MTMMMTRYTREYVDYVWEFNRNEANQTFLNSFDIERSFAHSYFIFTCLEHTMCDSRRQQEQEWEWEMSTLYASELFFFSSSFVHCCYCILFRLSTNTSPLRIIILTFSHWHGNLISYLSSFYSTETNVAVFVIIITMNVVVVILAPCISFYKSSTADVVARYFHYIQLFFPLWLPEVLRKRNMVVFCLFVRFLLWFTILCMLMYKCLSVGMVCFSLFFFPLFKYIPFYIYTISYNINWKFTSTHKKSGTFCSLSFFFLNGYLSSELYYWMFFLFSFPPFHSISFFNCTRQCKVIFTIAIHVRDVCNRYSIYMISDPLLCTFCHYCWHLLFYYMELFFCLKKIKIHCTTVDENVGWNFQIENFSIIFFFNWTKKERSTTDRITKITFYYSINCEV